MYSGVKTKMSQCSKQGIPSGDVGELGSCGLEADRPEQTSLRWSADN